MRHAVMCTRSLFARTFFMEEFTGALLELKHNGCLAAHAPDGARINTASAPLVMRERWADRTEPHVTAPRGILNTGATMEHESSRVNSGPPTTGPVNRRTFGQTLGMAALGGTLHGLVGTVSAQRSNAAPTDELCDLSAIDLVARIRRREVSARDVMTAHLARIERINPRVNAIVTLVAERALKDAAQADEVTARGGVVGVLHGLPVAHKDLVETAGIRTTRGSLFYRDNVPTRDALIVTRIRAAGAITCGKTNTPELGAGSQTFNGVFGATRNPYDLTKTCGGSSGGAAVALACGMLPIADGSDTGGSLRNPAAFCNVVGFRPSPGRVPGNSSSWSPLSVSGPMARSVADVALFLSAIAGHDPSSPLSIPESGARFREPLGRDFKGVRVAWWQSLGGCSLRAGDPSHHRRQPSSIREPRLHRGGS